MDLNSLLIFDKVAEHGSFTRASEELKMPKSNVSLKVRQLEDELGVRLLERSTRKVRMTDHGRRIQNLAKSLRDTAVEIRSVADEAHSNPKGLIKMTAPYDLGYELIRTAIQPFLSDYPEVDIELDLTNRQVNLVEEGFDLAVRASGRPLQDSSLISNKIGTTPLYLFAGAGTAFTQIKNIKSLATQPMITFGRGDIKLQGRGKEQVLKPEGRLVVHDMLSIKQAVIAGIGVGLLPATLCKSDVSEGRMERILPSWQSDIASFYLIYPSRRLLPPRVRELIAYLKRGIGTAD